MSIKSILEHKGSKVTAVQPDTRVGVAAHRLRLERIGALLVTGPEGRIEGILSERGIVHGLTEHRAAAVDLPLSAPMSPRVYSCKPAAGIRDVMPSVTPQR